MNATDDGEGNPDPTSPGVTGVPLSAPVAGSMLWPASRDVSPREPPEPSAREYDPPRFAAGRNWDFPFPSRYGAPPSAEPSLSAPYADLASPAGPPPSHPVPGPPPSDPVPGPPPSDPALAGPPPPDPGPAGLPHPGPDNHVAGSSGATGPAIPAEPPADPQRVWLREYLDTLRVRATNASSWRETSVHYVQLVNRDGVVPVTARFGRDDIEFLGQAREEVLGFAELCLRLVELHAPLDAGGISTDPSSPILRCRSCMWRWPCPTFRMLTEAVSRLPGSGAPRTR